LGIKKLKSKGLIEIGKERDILEQNPVFVSLEILLNMVAGE
jgi:hypothetical protein